MNSEITIKISIGPEKAAISEAHLVSESKPVPTLVERTYPGITPTTIPGQISEIPVPSIPGEKAAGKKGLPEPVPLDKIKRESAGPVPVSLGQAIIGIVGAPTPTFLPGSERTSAPIPESEQETEEKSGGTKSRVRKW